MGPESRAEFQTLRKCFMERGWIWILKRAITLNVKDQRIACGFGNMAITGEGGRDKNLTGTNSRRTRKESCGAGDTNPS